VALSATVLDPLRVIPVILVILVILSRGELTAIPVTMWMVRC